MRNEILEKIFNKKSKLIIGIILVIIAVCLELYNYIDMNKTLDSAVYFDEIREEGKYGYVDVQFMTDYFATYENDNSVEYIYFVRDDKYFYIAYLNKKNFNKLKKIYDYSYSDEDIEKPNSVRIYGVSKLIKNDLKSIAANNYNKMFKTDFMNSENATDYFGMMYIDTYNNPEGTFILMSIFPAIFLIVGLIYIYRYYKLRKKMNVVYEKFSSEMSKINIELSSNDMRYFKKANLYVTKSYIISITEGFEIFKFDDIRWIYPFDHYTNGALTNKNIVIVYNDGSVHSICHINANKKGLMLFDEVYSTITMKAPDAMHGYTEENINKNKELEKKN